MAQPPSGLAINTTLSDTLKKIYIILQGDPGTPRDNVILKHAKVALQSEVVRGLTVPEFVDTVDDFVSFAAKKLLFYNQKIVVYLTKFLYK